MAAAGFDFATLIKGLETAIALAVEQLAASALCVAIYITADGNATPKTKLDSMNVAKRMSNESGAAVDIRLMAKFEAGVKVVQAEAKLKRASIQ